MNLLRKEETNTKAVGRAKEAKPITSLMQTTNKASEAWF